MDEATYDLLRELMAVIILPFAIGFCLGKAKQGFDSIMKKRREANTKKEKS